MKPTFKNFITASGQSGYKIIDKDGNPYGQGFASINDVLHFYPNAVFIGEEDELEQSQFYKR